MLIVEYKNDEMGIVVADYEALSRAKQIVENLKKANRLVEGAEDYTISVSTENIVYAFRVLVAKGELDYSQIKFTFVGRLSDYPKGFCDTFDNFLTDLLTAEWEYGQEMKNQNKS